MRKLVLLALSIFFPLALCEGQGISGAGSFGCSGVTVTGTAATSATANNTVLYTALNIPAYAVKVQLDQTSTISGGAITFLQSDDGGVNYITVPTTQVLNEATGQQLTNPYTLVASTNQPFYILLNGNSSFQVKLTTAITGTATVTPEITLICQAPTAVQLLTFDANNNAKVVVNAALPAGSNVIGALTANQSVNVAQVNGNTTSTAATGVQKVGVVGNAGASVDQAPGSAVPANAVMEGLSDGTNTRFAQSDANGRQLVKQYPDTTTTSYHASKNVASAASATDIAVLPGNATNKVLVSRVVVTCTQTTAGIITLQLIKRSAADTSGTSSAMTVVPDYSSYAAGVSAPLVYTANPTTGTAVGNVDTVFLACLATGTAAPDDIYIFRPAKPIILNGTAEQLAVNLNGATVTGGSFNVTFEYAETTTP